MKYQVTVKETRTYIVEAEDQRSAELEGISLLMHGRAGCCYNSTTSLESIESFPVPIKQDQHQKFGCCVKTKSIPLDLAYEPGLSISFNRQFKVAESFLDRYVGKRDPIQVSETLTLLSDGSWFLENNSTAQVIDHKWILDNTKGRYRELLYIAINSLTLMKGV